MKKLLFSAIAVLCVTLATSQTSLFPMQGISVNTPKHENVDRFVSFIDTELAPMGVNTILLRVDYNYEFESIPEMKSSQPLSKADAKKILAVCKKNGIEIVPLVNLLGHQSWASKLNRLLEVYPQFDETPYVQLPADSVQPVDGLFEGGLYCKSYCPLHPDVHGVVFKLLGEIVDVFEAKALHAGMDEVFFLGEDGCPRCKGHDKAELFAGELNKISDYLKTKNARLWIWGDRLLNGQTTGLGMWEGSMNNTHRAIDMVDKSVVICDWHYERPDLTPVIFAAKGFDVMVCPWRIPEVAVGHVENTIMCRKSSSEVMKDRFQGVMHTVWGSTERFMDEYQNVKNGNPTEKNTEANTFYVLYNKINELKPATK